MALTVRLGEIPYMESPQASFMIDPGTFKAVLECHGSSFGTFLKMLISYEKDSTQSRVVCITTR